MNSASPGLNLPLKKKSWTVMVYLAADNNLADFGVNSLRQMKAAAGPRINVVAEFDMGPMSKNKRYFFDGNEPFGPIKDNEIERSGPVSAADPQNLATFIEWAAKNFPADHYFVVIWGHGAGIADNLPNVPDNTFVPRHPLLSLFKGILNIPLKGILNIPLKGMPNIAPHETLQEGFDTVYKKIIVTAAEVIDGFLSDKALAVIWEQAFGTEPAISNKALEALRKKIHADLESYGKSVKDGPLAVLQGEILNALQAGFTQAMDSGVLDQLQIEVLSKLHDHPHQNHAHYAARNGRFHGQAGPDRIDDLLRYGLFLAIQDSIQQALQMGIFDPSQIRINNGTKSLAFVDHPTSYISNPQLKMALRTATNSIGAKIDILGMDACNMNMAEIGYELRDSVGLLVASQDDIPDASWPYDRIISQLAQNPDFTPKDMATATVEQYVAAYEDYQDQQVSLSALDLGFCPELAGIVGRLTAALESGVKNFKGPAQMIVSARHQVRSFCLNQFVDLIHFCQLLSGGSSNLAAVASSDIAPLEFPIIYSNKMSAEEKNCNGTSIYFPDRVTATSTSLETISTYNQLDFAKMTGWGDFLSKYLAYVDADGKTHHKEQAAEGTNHSHTRLSDGGNGASPSPPAN